MTKRVQAKAFGRQGLKDPTRVEPDTPLSNHPGTKAGRSNAPAIAIGALFGVATLLVGVAMFPDSQAEAETSSVRAAKATVAELSPPTEPANPPRYVNSIGSFEDVAVAFRKELGCGTVTPASMGMGRLWGCILGKGQTAKLFINEGSDGQVSSIKVLWNDWTRDGGYGIHADRAEALKIANAIILKLELSGDLRDAMFHQVTRPVEAPAGMRIVYSFHSGPGIDERMATITPVRSPEVLAPRIAGSGSSTALKGAIPSR